MPREEQITYGLLCLASIGFYFIVIPWQVEEPIDATVSPALVPRVCAILIFALSALKLGLSLRSAVEGAIMSARHYGFLLGTLLAIAFLAYSMYWFGFWPCAFMVILVTQVIAGQTNPVKVLAYSAVLAGVSWWLLDLAGLYIIAPY